MTPDYGGMCVRVTEACLSSGYGGIRVFGLQRHVSPSYGGIRLRVTKVCVSGLRWYVYPGYRGMLSSYGGTCVLVTDVCLRVMEAHVSGLQRYACLLMTGICVRVTEAWFGCTDA